MCFPPRPEKSEIINDLFQVVPDGVPIKESEAVMEIKEIINHPLFNAADQVKGQRAATVCPGSSDPTYNIESNYFIQSNSYDLKLFCPVNE